MVDFFVFSTIFYMILTSVIEWCGWVSCCCFTRKWAIFFKHIARAIFHVHHESKLTFFMRC